MPRRAGAADQRAFLPAGDAAELEAAGFDTVEASLADAESALAQTTLCGTEVVDITSSR